MIAIYMIAKDEEHNVRRFMAHAREADHVVVAVSAESTDRTAELLQDAGATVHVLPDPMPWRWDAARNAALDLIPEDVDCCVSLDLDESLEPGWREALEETWNTGARWISYRYVSVMVDGRPGVTCYRSKVHARHGFRWEQPIHEKIMPIDPNTPTATCPGMVVLHHRAHPANYINHLSRMLQEDPDNADAYIQRGADYLATGEWDKCEADYLKMLSLTHGAPDDHTRAKRAWGWLTIANARHKCGDDAGAVLDALMSAVAAHPGLRDPWVYLAEALLHTGNAALAYGAAMTALSITDSQGHARDERCWGDLPKQIASAAYSHILSRGGSNG